jgi:hypothetical protein
LNPASLISPPKGKYLVPWAFIGSRIPLPLERREGRVESRLAMDDGSAMSD